jgi:hypothetical protein
VTSVLGIGIPSAGPVFLTVVLGIHIPVGLACVTGGIVAMLTQKGGRRHIVAGKVYFWCLTILFMSVTFLSFIRWAEDSDLFFIGTAAYACAFVGRNAMHRQWRHRGRLHIAGMGGSYMLMLVAFYVDNGPQLPIWKELPHIVYWGLPTVVGLPLILRALLHHPLGRLGSSS